MMDECPQFTQLLRWRDAGETEKVDAHLASCDDCAQAWAALADLTALGMQIPARVPEPRQVESVRTQLLARAEAAPTRRNPAWLAIAAAVLLGLATWSLWPGQPTPIASIDGATADYAVRYEAGVERVDLKDGRIAIEVTHLPADQRFVVQTADAEIEVRGTRFTVIAEDGRLQRVEVSEGRVEVRRAGHIALMLEAQDFWQAATLTPPEPAQPKSVAAASATPVSAPIPVKPTAAKRTPTLVATPKSAVTTPKSTPRRPVVRTPKIAVPKSIASAPKSAKRRQTPATAPAAATTSAPSSQPPATPQTEQFEAGWRALRAGDFDEASAAFSAAARLRGPLAADARWWHIVALGRAGRDAQTRSALVAYLRSRPAMNRRAEAQVMLGWLHFSAGQVDAAERAFKAGEGASRAQVRSGAKAGLKAVVDWRAQRQPSP